MADAIVKIVNNQPVVKVAGSELLTPLVAAAQAARDAVRPLFGEGPPDATAGIAGSFYRDVSDPYAPLEWFKTDAGWQGPQALKGDPGGTTDLIGTRQQAQSMTIGPEFAAVRTTGYAAPGDGGGGLYKRVVSEPAHAGKFQSAGGQWWEVTPDGVGVTLQQFGAKGLPGVDDRSSILGAIAFCAAKGGGVIGSVPGSKHHFTGRIRIPQGVVLDFGRSTIAAELWPTSADGGVELEAGGGLFAEIRAMQPGQTGPFFEINDQKSTTFFGRNERKTRFSVGLRGNRQPGSKGILIHSSDLAKGVAWVEGEFEVGEIDYPLDLISNGQGYVNENWLRGKIYDGVENCRLLVNGTGEVSSNRLTLSFQTGANARSGINLICDGGLNWIDVKCWDWTTARLNPAYDGTQIRLTDKSGGNHVTGFAARGLTGSGFGKPAVIDLAPNSRRNFVDVDDMRTKAPSERSLGPGSGYTMQWMVGDQDDELAFAANGRYAVTQSGAQSFAPVEAMFSPNGAGAIAAMATQAVLTVDLGAVVILGDFFAAGVYFQSDASKPDKAKVEFSSDGSAWTTVLTAGYDGGPVPLRLVRFESSLTAVRYIRLTCENNTARNINVNRLFAASTAVNRKGGAFVHRWGGEFYGPPNVLMTGHQGGYWVGGQRVIRERLSAVPNAVTGTEVATINALLDRLRLHGLIAS
ncbi:discoidin domain-containing protein [Brevundimonas vesicularis]|uniref:discoidin domain-containing protein n=1 Tax=Brevundimonas vesicularis TaxID=41276 RepID=UPI00384ADFC3